MAAIRRRDLDVVRQACEEAAEGQVVSPANINGPQGRSSSPVMPRAVEACMRSSQGAGRKASVPLQVSAPFHCALMKPAEDRLEPELRALTVHDPGCRSLPTLMRCPKTRRRGRRSTRWCGRCRHPSSGRRVVRRLASEGVTTYVEVGPGTVLGGLVKKIHPDARIANFGSPDNSTRSWRHVRSESEGRDRHRCVPRHRARHRGGARQSRGSRRGCRAGGQCRWHGRGASGMPAAAPRPPRST